MSDACLTCRFFVRHTRADRDVGEVNLTTGDCRRMPPRPLAGADGTPQRAIWSMVDKTDWCGAYSARQA